MGVFSDESLRRLFYLLNQNLKLVTDYYDLTVAQTDVIASGDTIQLNNNLDARQKIINSADKLHQELDLLMQSYASASAGLPASVCAEVSGLNDAVRDKLLAVSEVDERNRELMITMMSELSTDVRRLGNEKKSFSAYNQTGFVGGGFFDTKQ